MESQKKNREQVSTKLQANRSYVCQLDMYLRVKPRMLNPSCSKRHVVKEVEVEVEIEPGLNSSNAWFES
jgi:hypothetical protein